MSEEKRKLEESTNSSTKLWAEAKFEKYKATKHKTDGNWKKRIRLTPLMLRQLLYVLLGIHQIEAAKEELLAKEVTNISKIWE